jgi:hypothetical protein
MKKAPVFLPANPQNNAFYGLNRIDSNLIVIGSSGPIEAADVY